MNSLPLSQTFKTTVQYTNNTESHPLNAKSNSECFLCLQTQCFQEAYQVSLRNILLYLETKSSSYTTNCNGHKKSLVTLCDKCLKITKRLESLIHELKMVQMMVHDKLRTFHTILLESEKQLAKTKETETGVNNNLRQDTLVKCHQKIEKLSQLLPRVILSRVKLQSKIRQNSVDVKPYIPTEQPSNPKTLPVVLASIKTEKTEKTACRTWKCNWIGCRRIFYFQKSLLVHKLSCRRRPGMSVVHRSILNFQNKEAPSTSSARNIPQSQNSEQEESSNQVHTKSKRSKHRNNPLLNLNKRKFLNNGKYVCSCPYCDTTCSLSGDVRVHVITKHREKLLAPAKLSSVSDSTFVKLCATMIKNELLEAKRMETRNSKSPHPCPHCEKSFKRHRNLKYHLFAGHYDVLMEKLGKLQTSGESSTETKSHSITNAESPGEIPSSASVITPPCNTIKECTVQPESILSSLSNLVNSVDTQRPVPHSSFESFPSNSVNIDNSILTTPALQSNDQCLKAEKPQEMVSTQVDAMPSWSSPYNAPQYAFHSNTRNYASAQETGRLEQSSFPQVQSANYNYMGYYPFGPAHDNANANRPSQSTERINMAPNMPPWHMHYNSYNWSQYNPVNYPIPSQTGNVWNSSSSVTTEPVVPANATVSDNNSSLESTNLSDNHSPQISNQRVLKKPSEVQCSYCSKNISKISKLKYHNIRKHLDVLFLSIKNETLDLNRFTIICKDILDSEVALSMTQTNNGVRTIMQCEQCRTVYKYEIDFRAHLISHHYDILKLKIQDAQQRELEGNQRQHISETVTNYDKTLENQHLSGNGTENITSRIFMHSSYPGANTSSTVTLPQAHVPNLFHNNMTEVPQNSSADFHTSLDPNLGFQTTNATSIKQEY